MAESKESLSAQAREFVGVGASVGAGCHPCVTHHLKAGGEVGLDGQALLAAVTAAERVTADAAARMAQHARRHLPPTEGALAGEATVRDVTLAALGAAVAANSMPNIEQHLMGAAELGISRDELAGAVSIAHEVQQNAARIHARLTAKLLDTPPAAAAGQRAAEPATPNDRGCDDSCPCHDEDASAGTGPAPARNAAPETSSACCAGQPA